MPDLVNPNGRLLERASKGDRRAFASIFERYHQRLYRYCAAIVGNSEDAGDALQNTMVRVLAALPGERRKLELEPWLFRIAHNESVELVRRRRTSVDIDAVEGGGEGGADATLEARERLRQVVADLRELPERQRGALVMRELGGLGFEQIGEAFETSARVARQTVYEARVSLQEMEGGRAMPCDEVRQKLSDGDRRLIRRRDVRAHLRQCAGCREFEGEIERRREDLAAIAPLPALAAGSILHSLLGAGAGAAGHGASAASAGAIGKAVGGSVLAKTVATGAVVAAVGVAAADRSGLIHVLPRDGGSGSTPARSSAPGTPGGTRTASPESGTTPAAEAAGAAAGGAALRRHRAPSAGSRVGSIRGGASAEPRAGGANEAESSQPGTSNGSGAGAANAHGANPHANEHAATKFNNGQGGGQGKSQEHSPEHGAPAAPKSPPPHEPAPKPEPPVKGPPADKEPPGHAVHGTGKSDEAAE